MPRMVAILVRALVAAVAVGMIAACGQKGPLVMPDEPAAQQRASLPQTLRIGTPAAPASAARSTP